MDIPIYYLSLPHDLSGSRSKNRFRLELLWGVSKMLDLLETDQEFTMVFDYACDIEIHFQDSIEFFQIKTRSNCKSYTTKSLTKVDGEGSILGKLYILIQDKTASDAVTVAIVSNAPYTSIDSESLMNSFSLLSDEEKAKISEALYSELGVKNVDFSKIFYIQSGMNFEQPEDSIRGKLIGTFEKIKRCEPSNPNALYRLVYDTVSEKACYEYSAADYNAILRLKGISRKEFDELLDRHAVDSKTGINAASAFIDKIPNIARRKSYKNAMPTALKLLSTSLAIKKIEQSISVFLNSTDVGNDDVAVAVLENEFGNRFPLEVNEIERSLIYIMILKRFEDGVYDHESHI